MTQPLANARRAPRRAAMPIALAFALAFAMALVPASAQTAPASSSAASSSSSSSTSTAKKPAAKKKSTKHHHSSSRQPSQKAPLPDRISEIQTALSRDGYYTGNPNGKWDASTVAALQKFQSAQGLDATGKLDARSLQRLGLGSDVAGVSAPVAPPPPSTAAPASHPASQPPAPQPPAGTQPQSQPATTQPVTQPQTPAQTTPQPKL